MKTMCRFERRALRLACPCYRHQLVYAVLSAAFLISSAASGAMAPIVLGPKVLYDSRKASVQEEPGMWCSHPIDASQMIGITSAPEEASHSGNFLQQHYIVRRSDDGGRTWKKTLQTSGAPLETDPACAYGPDNQVYISAMSFFKKDDGANVWRSMDGGRTWKGPVRINQDRFLDRPFLNVDLGNTPYRGRLYFVAWGRSLSGDVLQRPDEIAVYTSDDSGKTFNPPAIIPTTSINGRGAVHLGQAVVMPDGTYVISWTELDMQFDSTGKTLVSSPGASVIKIARSVDGGRTFGSPIVVARSRWRIELNGHDLFVSKFYPSITVDRSSGPHKGNLYIAWAGATEGRERIMFSRSIDGGLKWSTPKTLSDDHPYDPAKPILGPHNKMVVLKVNKDGVLGAFYYAQGAPDPNVDFWPVFTASLDGGLTWEAPIHVLEQPIRLDAFNLDWNCVRQQVNEQGLPQPVWCSFPGRAGVPNCNFGLTGDAKGRFHIFAFSNPEGRPKFTSRTATVIGKVIRRKRLSTGIHIDIHTAAYDPTAQVVVARVAISNVGSKDIALPIRLVVDDTEAGRILEQEIHILNADNKRTDTGAWWDIESATGSQVLKPGEQSRSRIIMLRFAGRAKSSISSAPRMTLNLDAYATSE